LVASAPGTTVIVKSSAANALIGMGYEVQQIVWMSSPATASHTASASLKVTCALILKRQTVPAS